MFWTSLGAMRVEIVRGAAYPESSPLAWTVTVSVTLADLEGPHVDGGDLGDAGDQAYRGRTAFRPVEVDGHAIAAGDDLGGDEGAGRIAGAVEDGSRRCPG